MKSKQKGITLIALIVTIIILLILAGITISQITGENGLFAIAKKAKQNTIDAQEKEQQILDEYMNAMGIDPNLPENTPEIEAGTEVKLPINWGMQNVSYIKTSDGTEAKEIETVATVYAVSVGKGETIPVPKEFYYVGGTIASGVVISDNKSDLNKYAGKTDVGTDLVGNQFVWIPCTSSEYKKTNWGQGDVANRSNCYWNTTVDTAGKIQTKKYGGFYVARYEAGLDTSKAHKEPQALNSNIHDNETAKPQSKAGLVPWNFVSWNTAKARAEEMHNTNYVSSGLITGTQWDVMINKIAEKIGASLTDSDWGNYDNKAITYTGPGATYDESAGKLGIFAGNGGTTNSTTGTGSRMLLYTGSSVQCTKYNLYDVAGNLWEWTEETSYYGGNAETEYRVLRGGGYYSVSSSYPVCYRFGIFTTTYVHHHVGFRVVLYIK